MENRFKDILKEALNRKVENITFSDNSYYNEEFINESIQSDFIGWYDENNIIRQINFIQNSCNLRVNSKILDVACGHGKHSELLSKKDIM